MWGQRFEWQMDGLQWKNLIFRNLFKWWINQLVFHIQKSYFSPKKIVRDFGQNNSAFDEREREKKFFILFSCVWKSKSKSKNKILFFICTTNKSIIKFWKLHSCIIKIIFHLISDFCGKLRFLSPALSRLGECTKLILSALYHRIF